MKEENISDFENSEKKWKTLEKKIFLPESYWSFNTIRQMYHHQQFEKIFRWPRLNVFILCTAISRLNTTSVLSNLSHIQNPFLLPLQLNIRTHTRARAHMHERATRTTTMRKYIRAPIWLPLASVETDLNFAAAGPRNLTSNIADVRETGGVSRLLGFLLPRFRKFAFANSRRKLVCR